MKKYLNKKYVIPAILELALLIWALSGFFQPKASYEFPYSQLGINSGSVNEENQSVTIDQSSKFKGYFSYTPPVDLKRGTYTITVDYETSTNNNTLDCITSSSRYDVVVCDEFALEPDDGRVAFTVWVKENISAFQVIGVFGGKGYLNIYNVKIEQTGAGARMNLVYALAFITIINLFLLLKSKINEKNKASIYTKGIVFTALIGFASYPLFCNFMIEGHDLAFHLLRIESIKDGWLSGQFPVRMSPTMIDGYGYPNSVFYGDILLYFPALLRLVGFPLQTCYKLYVFAVNIGTCLFSYYCIKGITKKENIGLMGAALYMLCPYRISNLYIRAALGEYSAMMFAPLIILGLYKIYTEDIHSPEYKRYWILPVIGYTGIINSHIISCEMIGMFTVIVCLILFKKTFRKETFLVLFKIVAFSVLINLFFLLPLLDYMRIGGFEITENQPQSGMYIQASGAYLMHLFSLFPSGHGFAYGHGVSPYYDLGISGEMGLTTGIGLMIAVPMFIYTYITVNDKKNPIMQFGKFSCIVSVITLFMATNLFPWNFLTDYLGILVYVIQFPWRLLSISSIFLVITACVCIYYLDETKKGLFAITAIILSLVSSGYVISDMFESNNAYRVYDIVALDTSETSSGSEYLPYGTEYAPLSYTFDSSENISFLDYRRDFLTVKIKIRENYGTEGYVEVPLLYYPGYSAQDSEGNDFEIHKGSNNVINLMIPANYEGAIVISYHEAWYWRVAEIISVLSIIGLTAYGIWQHKRTS